jgi:hypothetical protein
MDLPRATAQAYLGMVMRLARVLLLLAALAVSLVIGLGTSGTGAIEKIVLVALIAGCIYLAAKVSTFAARAQAHLQRH